MGARLSKLVVLAVVATVLWIAVRGQLHSNSNSTYPVPDTSIYLFPGVAGPAGKSIIAPPGSNDIARYSVGGASRLAILLTDPDSAWRGLAHGLKSIGVPFLITRDYRAALRHRVVLVYPQISGKVLSQEALSALARFPRDGGTLIGQNVFGGELNKVFGFADAIPSLDNSELRLLANHTVTAEFTLPEERVIRVSNNDSKTVVKGTYAYTAPINPPLAVYEDGRAAITQKPYASGKAYAFGVDLGYHLLMGHNGRQNKMVAATYANGFAPTLDVLLRLIKNIYVEGNVNAITLATVPAGKALSVILTHDVDYTRSMANAVEYAQFENSRGIKATYFIQTKYVRDWNDDIFFNAEAIASLSRLRDLGMELGSHSVSHSYVFSAFPLGSGTERYPDYRPFVKERRLAYNGTVLGELRVSRFLLERLLPQTKLSSFRAGHLQHPFNLPEALAATDYRFDSTMTANMALTHLPFQLNYSRGPQAEVNVYEFPITIEDEIDAPMLNRLPQALDLARKLSRYGGLFVVLIHPDILGQKLEFERKFVDAVREGSWFGTLADFGAWWQARDSVEVDVISDGGTQKVHLVAKLPIKDLTLNIPRHLKIKQAQSGDTGVRQHGTRVVIDHLHGELMLKLERR